MEGRARRVCCMRRLVGRGGSVRSGGARYAAWRQAVDCVKQAACHGLARSRQLGRQTCSPCASPVRMYAAPSEQRQRERGSWPHRQRKRDRPTCPLQLPAARANTRQRRLIDLILAYLVVVSSPSRVYLSVRTLSAVVRRAPCAVAVVCWGDHA